MARKRKTQFSGDEDEVARKERVLKQQTTIGNAKDFVYGIRRSQAEQKEMEELRREAIELGLLD